MGWLADFWRDLNTRPGTSGGRGRSDTPPLRRSGGVPQLSGRHAAKPNPRDRFKNLPDSYQPRGNRQTADTAPRGTTRGASGRNYPATGTRRAAPGVVARDNQGNLRENRARAQLAARRPVMGQPYLDPQSRKSWRDSEYDRHGRAKATARRMPAPLASSNSRGTFGASAVIPSLRSAPKRKRPKAKRKIDSFFRPLPWEPYKKS